MLKLLLLLIAVHLINLQRNKYKMFDDIDLVQFMLRHSFSLLCTSSQIQMITLVDLLV